MSIKKIGNSMHTGDSHPFHKGGKWANHRPSAHTTGVASPPGGEGSLQSANGAMRKKTPLQGPGKA